MSDPTPTIAHQVADRAELARIADHQTMLNVMVKLSTPLEPPDPVPVIDAKLDQLEVVFARKWQEFRPQAEAVHAVALLTLTAARVESVRVAKERTR